MMDRLLGKCGGRDVQLETWPGKKAIRVFACDEADDTSVSK